MGEFLSGLLFFYLILTMPLPKKGASVGMQETDPTPHAFLWGCLYPDTTTPAAGQPSGIKASTPPLQVSAFLYRDALL